MPTCLIGLGANLGNRRATLQQAVDLLAEHPRIRVLRASRWRETQAAGGPSGQPPYLNGAALVETPLDPETLLVAIQEIENKLGRRRQQRWEPRTIDLDLLLVDERVWQSPRLVLPHPRMAWRRFVLEPAAEIAPEMLHPPTRWTLARLLQHLNTTPLYVAVTGTFDAAETDFARRVADACSAETLRDAWNASRGPVEPSGLELAAALQCLRRRARLLAADDPRWSRADRSTVSDFWFGESRALAAGGLVASRASLVFRQWQRFQGRVARPRLIVDLDVRPARSLERVLQKRLRAALERQLRRRDVGPVLRLADPRSAEAVDEVAAAIAAMA